MEFNGFEPYAPQMRLNPFFIRSAVGINLERGLDSYEIVLIPSSSGLRLEYWMEYKALPEYQS